MYFIQVPSQRRMVDTVLSDCTCPAVFFSEIGWRAEVNPRTHPVNELEFDVIIGADGRRNTLAGKCVCVCVCVCVYSIYIMWLCICGCIHAVGFSITEPHS